MVEGLQTVGCDFTPARGLAQINAHHARASTGRRQAMG
jgi:hypothetical protein